MKEEASIYMQGRREKGGEMWVTSDTLTALFTLQYCQNPAIGVVLVEPTLETLDTGYRPREDVHDTKQDSREEIPWTSEHSSDTHDLREACLFPVDPSVFTFNFLVLEEEDCPSVLANCSLPAVIINSEPMWCVAGLCSALRFMLHRTVEVIPQHHAGHLLGFRGSCLQACAEVSVWTKFCEVEVLATLREVAILGCVRFGGHQGAEEAKEKAKAGGGVEETGNEVEEAGGEMEEAEGRVEEAGIRVEEVNIKMKKASERLEQARKRVKWRVRAQETRESLEVPSDLVRYEHHLQRPPLLHNALKVKQQYIRETVKDQAELERMLQLSLSQLPDIEHKFAEGLNMTLADVLLFVSFHILLTKLESYVSLDYSIPLVLKWHKVILDNEYVKGAVPVLSSTVAHMCSKLNLGVCLKAVIPNVPDQSIYKSDPERYKPRWRSFTHQDDIEAVLGMLEEKDVELEYSNHPADTISLPWPSLPPPVNPKDGQLPPSRLERKCQQLENVVAAVEWAAQNGDTIVDFCAGGGHVGIILAYRLPQCKIVLVENKEESLLRAKVRIDMLGLKNLVFAQCNLDYFKGKFQVGVSLHACGVATDLVMLKCVEQRAAFVCSPCCYGGVQANHILAYPRSQAYRGLHLTLNQYLTLGHAADQTHDHNNPKTSQGQQCMRLVDSDRLRAAQEVGYSTSLTLMQPPHCTPKNHLLIGVLAN